MLSPVLRDGMQPGRPAEARLAEAVGLARAIDLTVVHAETVRLSRRRPATLFGRGAVETFQELIAAEEIGLTVVDASLTPIQQRNLERAWSCKVIDRTGLILEIFGERARTREGQLQVELAALTYQRSRLVRSWTHLERQRGGFGFLGGPGESQLEMDRRLIGDRITKIKRDLEEVKRTRALHRRARRRVPYPVVALVGYTNAGKSTLFNRLTRAEVMAQDLLFATLDPTMRAVRLPSGRDIILSDTVGFISDLPTDLVAAFRATLEEVQEADIVIHVRDISHPETAAQKQDVDAVLQDLGLDPALADGLIEALNKIDLLEPASREQLVSQAEREPDQIPISAAMGEGCPDLLAEIDRRLAAARQVAEYRLGHDEGSAIAWLYDHGEVLGRREDEAFSYLRVSLDPADISRFERMRARLNA
ncbi:GTPase HflX [Virgifigura deserti]|uniref:GTPase HflX n=1 Tax=Virgifigura deserti TaxID=2268457 RepID=UPI003CCBF84A